MKLPKNCGGTLCEVLHFFVPSVFGGAAFRVYSAKPSVAGEIRVYSAESECIRRKFECIRRLNTLVSFRVYSAGRSEKRVYPAGIRVYPANTHKMH